MATLRKAERLRDTIHDFEVLIRERYPDAKFGIVKGFDPPGTYLEVVAEDATFEDASDGIFEAIRDRLVEMLDEGPLPLYVMPVVRLSTVS